ncbi:uncharacterized protein LOC121857265 [Homarus americanus]|uniref:uncharacterized protein LOC121857265 n=1 Tax=Homarus americanus TaxID=6706 RepID=UPI001C4773DC|nr:uncharacterized protein LOC121857265 [Homarus americanus]
MSTQVAAYTHPVKTCAPKQAQLLCRSHTTAPHTTAPHTTAPHTTTTTKLSTTVSVSTTPQPFGCLFKPDCEGKPLGYLEPDPDNCLKYYFCLGDGSMVSDSLACSQGDYFNPFRHDCEKIVDDSYACLPPCDGICPYSCNDNDRIFDPEDCSSFYFCLQGTYYHMSCPANTPYFNGTQCTPDQGSCCSYPCPPYCPYAGKWVPDGNNCHRFYICLDIGTPTPDTLLTCPDNGVFDYKLGECSSTAKCVTLCDLHH